MKTRTWGTSEVAALIGTSYKRTTWLAARLGIAKNVGQGRRAAYTSAEVVALAIASGLIAENDQREGGTDLSPAWYVLAHFPRASECPELVAWIVGTEVVIHGTAETIMKRSKKARRLGYVMRVVHLAPILEKVSA